MLKKKLKSYYRFFIQRIFFLIYGKIKIGNIESLQDVNIIEITNLKFDRNQNRKYFL